MIDVSNATLDVIEAIRNQKVVQFKYGSHDEFRTIEPESFYGDFNGFQGADVGNAGGFRRFSFDRVTEWIGIPIIYNAPPLANSASRARRRHSSQRRSQRQASRR